MILLILSCVLTFALMYLFHAMYASSKNCWHCSHCCHWYFPILSLFLQRTSPTHLLHIWQYHHQTPSHSTLQIVFLPFGFASSTKKGLAAAPTWWIPIFWVELYLHLLLFYFLCGVEVSFWRVFCLHIKRIPHWVLQGKVLPWLEYVETLFKS